MAFQVTLLLLNPLWLLGTWRRNAIFIPPAALFVADGLPKTQRIEVPQLAEVLHYLDTVRESSGLPETVEQARTPMALVESA